MARSRPRAPALQSPEDAIPDDPLDLPSPWRNRIVGQGVEAPDQLLANPNNVRIHPRHQQDALLDVLQTIGLVQDVIVNRTTGQVVDGHMRILLALREGVPAIPVKYVELTAEEELVVLHTFDPLSALAAYDRQLLAEHAPEVLGQVAGSHALAAFFEDLVARNAPAELSFAGDDGNGGGNFNPPVNGVDAAPAAVPAGPVLDSQVKMVSLFFTVATHPVFMTQVSALMTGWGLDNVTDVVARAVAEAYQAVPLQQVDDEAASERAEEQPGTNDVVADGLDDEEEDEQ